jgi:hypothetical protein
MVTDRGGRLYYGTGLSSKRNQLAMLQLNPRLAQLCWWALTTKVRLVPSLTFCRITSPKNCPTQNAGNYWKQQNYKDKQTVAQ